MNGEIAQRSIRSSMSRIVDARLPRLISSVTGSTSRAAWVAAGVRVSGMGALQEEVVGVVQARPEAGRHQAGRVVLVDNGRAVEGHARREPGARVHGDVGGAGAAEVHRALPGERGPGGY